MKYVAFCDPSGGSSDSMTLAVAHLSLFKKCVLDGVWERRPPFSPDAVCEEFAGILATYRVRAVTGDRYSAQWVVERFKAHGVTYQHSLKTRSEIYGEFAALANSGRVRMPASPRLRMQFKSLERRSSRSGKDTIDHPPASHDDIANAAAGALTLAAGGLNPAPEPWSFVITASTPRKSAFDNLSPTDTGPERWWHKIN
jgi:hypothetical protein